MPLLASIVLALLVHQPVTDQGRLVFENSRMQHFSSKDGVLTLRRGSGWLRYSKVLLDFDLSFEYRLTSEDTDAGVVFRSWTGEGEWPEAGYRLRLPNQPRPDPSSLITPKKRKLAMVSATDIVLRPATEWQAVRVRAAGERITITINGAVATEADVETMGGVLLFDARKGGVQLRSVTITNSEDFSRPLPVESASADAAAPLLKSGRLTMPEPVFEVRPLYTKAAMEKQVQGTVELEAVVLPNGRVGDIRLVRTLHDDLDRSAIAAVRAWRFKPALKDGKPVPISVSIELTFTLR